MADALNRNPGPWAFYVHLYGFKHVVVDADGRYMVSGVPIGSGPLLAAGPELLAALERVANVAPPDTEAHEVAAGAIERFREREGMIVADWMPGEALPRPGLRVVGVAT